MVPVSYLLLARVVERVKALRSAPARVPQAVRVAGVVLLVALVGWLLSATSVRVRLRSRQTTSYVEPQRRPRGTLSL